VHGVQLAFAHSTQTVFYVMAGVMAGTFLVSVRGLPWERTAPADELSATSPIAADLDAVQ
jgi:hypothetical protein